MPDSRTLIAVDVGNSRIKIGCFARVGVHAGALPEPAETLDLSVVHATGEFEQAPFKAWSRRHAAGDCEWRVASVHRAAAEQFTAVVDGLGQQLGGRWTVRRLTYGDVRLAIHVDAPERVGIDRLLAAVAADRLRRPERPAIVVDAGTAITVDLLDASGTFCGGAILPGIGMSARALEEQTDALPRVPMVQLSEPPAALGKSTAAAIEAGLYWGAVGAIRELVRRLSEPLAGPPDVFLTGGASATVAKILAASDRWPVRHVPHLVLGGIAVVDG